MLSLEVILRHIKVNKVVRFFNCYECSFLSSLAKRDPLRKRLTGARCHLVHET